MNAHTMGRLIIPVGSIVRLGLQYIEFMRAVAWQTVASAQAHDHRFSTVTVPPHKDQRYVAISSLGNRLN